MCVCGVSVCVCTPCTLDFAITMLLNYSQVSFTGGRFFYM